jgi:hypothetical protein
LDLPKLEQANLAHNQLNGEVPAGLNNSVLLKNLDLSHNQFSGSLPSWPDLAELKILNLANNQLSGALPDFSGLVSLDAMNLENNPFSGALPDLTALVKLQSVSLDRKQCETLLPRYRGINFHITAINNKTRIKCEYYGTQYKSGGPPLEEILAREQREAEERLRRERMPPEPLVITTESGSAPGVIYEEPHFTVVPSVSAAKPIIAHGADIVEISGPVISPDEEILLYRQFLPHLYIPFGLLPYEPATDWSINRNIWSYGK